MVKSRMLNQVEDIVEQTTNKMSEGLKRMKQFIQANSDTKQQYTIIALSIILTMLLIFVILF